MKKQIMIITLALIAILVSVFACSAATLTVGTGETYLNISSAYNASNNGDTILIKNGTYTGSANRAIDIQKNLIITGESQTGTIIDAEGNDYIFYINNSYTVTISKLTLRNGNTTFSGGAILNNGTCNVNKCTFTNNEAPSTTAYKGDGGAIYNTGNLTVIDSNFSGNTARWAAGAIESSGNLTVVNSTFTDNHASHGGAIHNYQGTLTVTGSNFSGNAVIYHGGAIYNQGAFTLINSNFTGNNANDNGGAIYHYQGTLTVTDSNFSGNSADDYGGAIRNDDELTITGSTFTNNYADYDGGAIYNYGPCIMTGCTFTGNGVYYSDEYVDEYGGGAIHNENDLTIKDSKFVDNTATGCSGGAIYACCGDITLLGCIFNGNTADYGGAIYDYGNLINITGCNFNSNTAEHGGAIYCDHDLVIKYSRFVGNTAKELGQDIYMYNGEYPSDARYNWWGSNNGPAEGRIMTGETSADREIYGPWLVMNINADPSTIYTGKTSKTSVNVYTDSNGVDHSADAAQFFSGPEVTFTTDLGNVGSKSVTVPWTLGMAFAVLRGDEGPGVATLTATDVETLSTTVNILQAPVTPDETPEETPDNEVNAASNTVGMQETGIPFAGLILAIFAVFAGLLAPKRK